MNTYQCTNINIWSSLFPEVDDLCWERRRTSFTMIILWWAGLCSGMREPEKTARNFIFLIFKWLDPLVSIATAIHRRVTQLLITYHQFIKYPFGHHTQNELVSKVHADATVCQLCHFHHFPPFKIVLIKCLTASFLFQFHSPRWHSYFWKWISLFAPYGEFVKEHFFRCLLNLCVSVYYFCFVLSTFPSFLRWNGWGQRQKPPGDIRMKYSIATKV